MSYLKDQLPTFIVGALVAVIIYLLTKPKDTSTVDQFRIDELKKEMRGAIKSEFDSLTSVIQRPVFLPATLDTQMLHLQKQTLNEIRNSRNKAIDSMSSDELQRTFAGYQ